MQRFLVFVHGTLLFVQRTKKTGIEEAIETEKLKQALVEDENSIKKYFEMYAKADFDDEDTRNQVLEYFVDKIYVYNDRLVITSYY